MKVAKKMDEFVTKMTILKQDLSQFYLYNTSTVVSLLVLLRLAVLLNQKRRDDFLPELKAQGQNQQLCLQLPKVWLEQHPLLVADLQQEQLQLKKIAFVLDCPYLTECSLQNPGFDPASAEDDS